MNIHRRGISQTSIDHYENVCKTAKFSIKAIKNLPEKGCENGTKDNNMLEYRPQREVKKKNASHCLPLSPI